MIGTWGTAPLDAASSAQLPPSFALLHTVSTAMVAAFHMIPNFWLYAVIGLFAAMYVLLFGVSAAAYRTLYAPR